MRLLSNKEACNVTGASFSDHALGSCYTGLFCVVAAIQKYSDLVSQADVTAYYVQACHNNNYTLPRELANCITEASGPTLRYKDVFQNSLILASYGVGFIAYGLAPPI